MCFFLFAVALFLSVFHRRSRVLFRLLFSSATCALLSTKSRLLSRLCTTSLPSASTPSFGNTFDFDSIDEITCKFFCHFECHSICTLASHSFESIRLLWHLPSQPHWRQEGIRTSGPRRWGPRHCQQGSCFIVFSFTPLVTFLNTSLCPPPIVKATFLLHLILVL
jgi:hypothetical protein